MIAAMYMHCVCVRAYLCVCVRVCVMAPSNTVLWDRVRALVGRSLDFRIQYEDTMAELVATILEAWGEELEVTRGHATQLRTLIARVPGTRRVVVIYVSHRTQAVNVLSCCIGQVRVSSFTRSRQSVRQETMQYEWGLRQDPIVPSSDRRDMTCTRILVAQPFGDLRIPVTLPRSELACIASRIQKMCRRRCEEFRPVPIWDVVDDCSHTTASRMDVSGLLRI